MRFQSELQKLIETDIAQLTLEMTNNGVIQNMRDFKYKLGKIDALKHVLINLLNEAERKSEER